MSDKRPTRVNCINLWRVRFYFMPDSGAIGAWDCALFDVEVHRLFRFSPMAIDRSNPSAIGTPCYGILVSKDGLQLEVRDVSENRRRIRSHPPRWQIAWGHLGYGEYAASGTEAVKIAQEVCGVLEWIKTASPKRLAKASIKLKREKSRDDYMAREYFEATYRYSDKPSAQSAAMYALEKIGHEGRLPEAWQLAWDASWQRSWNDVRPSRGDERKAAMKTLSDKARGAMRDRAVAIS